MAKGIYVHADDGSECRHRTGDGLSRCVNGRLISWRRMTRKELEARIDELEASLRNWHTKFNAVNARCGVALNVLDGLFQAAENGRKRVTGA